MTSSKQNVIIEEDIEIKEIKIKKETKVPVPKQYYSVKIEASAPITLFYRILAETPEQALEIIEKTPASCQMERAPKPIVQRAKKNSVQVYLSGTSLIKLAKKY